jgi:hypothetical protein
MAFPLGACSFFGRAPRHRNRLREKATLPMLRTASPSDAELLRWFTASRLA